MIFLQTLISGWLKASFKQECKLALQTSKTRPSFALENKKLCFASTNSKILITL
jgi:hypothetical protein